IYGIVGLLMLAFAQFNFIFHIQPFSQWYFPIIWFGYIFFIDALVYKLRGKSLIYNRPKTFIFMLLLSAAVWWMFEGIGWMIGNWYYTGIAGFGGKAASYIFATISFATVIPAVFETFYLLRAIHLFDHVELKRKHMITKRFLRLLTLLGLVFLILPLVAPLYFYPLIWLAFFLLIDPYNYIHKRPSVIGHLKDRKMTIPVSLFVAGMICGFLWEFWNFWAIPQWHYNIPFVDFFHIFEMPALGYLGYGPFAWELYAMYHFIVGLKRHK
ncbi:MAG: hypothetical protein KKC05_01305, partial [Nanoarchaeota archaeon]|nr:hypothetical protein [Nanoarchaeota archaeon]